MKKIRLLIIAVILLISCGATATLAADKPLSQLTAATTIAAEDLLMISYYSGGNYYSRKLTFANMLGSLNAYYQPLIAGADGSYGVSLQNNNATFAPYSGYTHGFAYIANQPYGYFAGANHKLIYGAITLASFSWDGSGSAIATNLGKVCRVISDPSTITGISLSMDTSSTTAVAVYKNAFSDAALPSTDITGGALITTTAKRGKVDNTLSGWTVAVSAGDEICAEMTTNNNATRATLIINGTR